MKNPYLNYRDQYVNYVTENDLSLCGQNTELQAIKPGQTRTVRFTKLITH